MKNLIALVALGFGAFIVYSKYNVGLTSEELVKAGAGILGGLGFLGYNNAGVVKGLFTSAAAAVTTKTVTLDKPEIKLEAGIFPPKDFEVYDNVSLVHIRNRLLKAKHKEGLETCAKLADIMFKLDFEEVTDEKVSS